MKLGSFRIDVSNIPSDMSCISTLFSRGNKARPYQALNRLADEACVRPRPLAMAITLEDSMLSGGAVVVVVGGTRTQPKRILFLLGGFCRPSLPTNRNTQLFSINLARPNVSSIVLRVRGGVGSDTVDEEHLEHVRWVALLTLAGFLGVIAAFRLGCSCCR